MQYTVDYFINKFEAIPEAQIGESQLAGCAYGQCRSRIDYQDGHETKEGLALEKIMSSLPGLKKHKESDWGPYDSTPARINNGDVKQYQQPTPKQRILAALYDIKKMQEPKVKEVIKYVSVPTTISEQAAETVLN